MSCRPGTADAGRRGTAGGRCGSWGRHSTGSRWVRVERLRPRPGRPVRQWLSRRGACDRARASRRDGRWRGSRNGGCDGSRPGACAGSVCRERVHEEAADELVGFERHDLGAAVVAIILAAEGHLRVGDADQAGVGDRDAMGVAVGEHLLGAAEGRLGVDDPLDPPQRGETTGEGGGLGEFRKARRRSRAGRTRTPRGVR